MHTGRSRGGPAPREAPEPASPHVDEAEPPGTGSKRAEIEEDLAAQDARVPADQRVQGESPGSAHEPTISDTPNQPTRASGRPSAELEAGMAAEGNPRPPGHQTHHVVADRDPRAREARNILRKAGIKPRNDPRNGVHLPQRLEGGETIPDTWSRHPAMHTDGYYEELTRRLRDARNNARFSGQDPDLAVERELQKITQEISNGKFPHPKKRD